MDTCCSIWNEHSGASAGKVPWVTPRKPVCSPVLHLQMMLLLLIKQWAGEEEAGCALLAWAAGSSGNMKQGEYVFYLSFCSLESNLRAADGRAKRWCLVMSSGTGRGEKKGKSVDVIETVLQIKSKWHGSTGNAGGIPASASRNGFSVATGLCYSAVSPALNLSPICSQLISASADQFSICS